MWKRCLYSAILAAVFLLTVTQVMYGADEGLDAGFGTEGRLDVTIGGYGDRANAVLIQPDGRILVGGSSSSAADLDFSVLRFLPDGSRDRSFNYDGSVVTPVGKGDDEILALGLLPDGRIIAGGYSSNGRDRDFALACYLPDGTPDRDFGLDGQVVTQVGNGDDEITALAIDSKGRILVTGSAAGTSGRVVVLARYLDNGTLDPSFGVQGMNLSGIGTDAIAEGIGLQKDGRIIVSGSYSDGTRSGMMVAGFTPDGQLDTAFGSKGIGVTAESGMTSEGYGLLVRGDGSILVAGSVGAQGKRDAALFGFTANGRPDPDFGQNGVLVSPAGPEDDVLFAVGTDGHTIRASGYATEDGRHRFLLVTYDRDRAAASAPAAPDQPAAASGPAATGTTLHIGKLRVADSMASSPLLQEEKTSARLVPRLTTTAFDTSDAVSYALAIQPDGKVVTVGAGSDPDGTDSVAIARYAETSADGTGTATPFNGSVLTRSVSQVTRTGAVVTSEIVTGETIVERGVVFSTTPYPDLEGVSPGNPDTPPDGSLGVSISSPANGATLGAGTTQTTLAASTSVDATCEYSMTSDSGATAAPQTSFTTTGGREHSTTLTGLSEGSSYTVTVTCTGADSGEQASATVSFSVATASKLLRKTARSIGDFLVTNAYAVSTITETQSTTDTAATTPATPPLFSALDDKFVTSGSTSDGSGSGIFSSVLDNLRPGTFFYVRAYAKTESGVVHYGNQLGFRTADSCFIATAAFGSILHPYVRILRDFRDQFLLGNGPGKMLVALYYRYSPRIADHIAAVPALRAVTRILLLPVVGAAWIALQAGLAGVLLVVAAMVAAWWCLASPRTFRRR